VRKYLELVASLQPTMQGRYANGCIEKFSMLQATSALDSVSERLVQGALDRLMKVRAFPCPILNF